MSLSTLAKTKFYESVDEILVSCLKFLEKIVGTKMVFESIFQDKKVARIFRDIGKVTTFLLRSTIGHFNSKSQ